MNTESESKNKHWETRMKGCAVNDLGYMTLFISLCLSTGRYVCLETCWRGTSQLLSLRLLLPWVGYPLHRLHNKAPSFGLAKLPSYILVYGSARSTACCQYHCSRLGARQPKSVYTSPADTRLPLLRRAWWSQGLGQGPYHAEQNSAKMHGNGTI